ncbi:MAG: hypothetical protein EOP83_02100 [Verrucomicrobiaceae bacterium]|nr:MAG: hypothetical protein EOP83_02100 [Verrucomicrobiaceae bacterium]
MPCIEWTSRGWKKLLVPKPRIVMEWPIGSFRAEKEAVYEWLNSDEAAGYFCDTSRWPPPGQTVYLSNIMHVWRFSDPNTAFMFKMRFG